MTIAKCEAKKKQYRWGGHYEAKYVCSAAAAVMLSPRSPINSHTTVGAEDWNGSRRNIKIGDTCHRPISQSPQQQLPGVDYPGIVQWPVMRPTTDTKYCMGTGLTNMRKRGSCPSFHIRSTLNLEPLVVEQDLSKFERNTKKKLILDQSQI